MRAGGALALACAKSVLAVAALALTAAAPPQPPAGPAIWTTLGTHAGPTPSATRSEPANLLQAGGQAILVDAGDGATVQLAKAGVPLSGLHVLVLSHLHFDHTGGLFAVIAERYQMAAPGVLTIYGPPGTRTMVDGLLAAMAPSPPSGLQLAVPPADTVKVVEVDGGSSFRIGPIKVTAARNTHYEATLGGDRYVSLSYRFDTPGRAIVFTGDTGPSAAVEQLARHADLLVSEVLDPAFFETRKASRPDLPPSELAALKRHFEEEHLSPEQAGLLAEHAGVKALVLTHDATDPAQAPAMRPAIAANYRGPITFATDLDRF